MQQDLLIPVDAAVTNPTGQRHLLPAGYVPTPSAAYRHYQADTQAPAQQVRARRRAPVPQPEPTPEPLPAPPPAGSRVLIWKQDPSVAELGTRKSFLPGLILDGPSDARIVSGQPGIAPVSPNVFGDFIVAPDTEQFDAIHTFTVVRQTLTMYQRALAAGGDAAPLPWQWNSGSNTAALHVFPHGLANVMNAYYSRNEHALKFGDFIDDNSGQRIYTCRSLDIVSHEAGHAVLDGLKPRWLQSNNPPQTGGLHEAFGDLSAIFLTLSQLDQVEAIIAQTKADLHDKTFLSDMAEQFGLALGQPNGLRNADNDLKLSEAGNEVHAISQVFTGAVYDILADIFSFERRPGAEDDAAVLHRVGDYLRGLVLRALIAAPDIAATYADVANQMLLIAGADGKPEQYGVFIRNRFVLREVLEAPLLPAQANPYMLLEAGVVDAPGVRQDRRDCCGTMNHAQYLDNFDVHAQEREALALWCSNYRARSGGANGSVPTAALDQPNGNGAQLA